MPVVEVADPSDPALADYRHLTDVALRSALEPAHGLYMAEGGRVVERALAAGHRPRSVLVEHKRLPQAQRLLQREPGATIYTAPASIVREIAGYSVHRGFLAAMQRPRPRAVAEVVAGWMASDGHCANLMNPAFRDIGLACVSGTASNVYRSYWTMVLGAS